MDRRQNRNDDWAAAAPYLFMLTLTGLVIRLYQENRHIFNNPQVREHLKAIAVLYTFWVCFIMILTIYGERINRFVRRFLRRFFP